MSFKVQGSNNTGKPSEVGKSRTKDSVSNKRAKKASPEVRGRFSFSGSLNRLSKFFFTRSSNVNASREIDVPPEDEVSGSSKMSQKESALSATRVYESTVSPEGTKSQVSSKSEKTVEIESKPPQTNNIKEEVSKNVEDLMKTIVGEQPATPELRTKLTNIIETLTKRIADSLGNQLESSPVGNQSDPNAIANAKFNDLIDQLIKLKDSNNTEFFKNVIDNYTQDLFITQEDELIGNFLEKMRSEMNSGIDQNIQKYRNQRRGSNQIKFKPQIKRTLMQQQLRDVGLEVKAKIKKDTQSPNLSENLSDIEQQSEAIMIEFSSKISEINQLSYARNKQTKIDQTLNEYSAKEKEEYEPIVEFLSDMKVLLQKEIVKQATERVKRNKKNK